MAERPSSTGLSIAAAVACIAVIPWVYLLWKGDADARREVDTAVAVTAGGNPAAGHEVIVSSGCAACHDIPGIRGPQGKIGPPLSGFKDRAMIGGVLANTPDNLILWLQDPPAADQKTAMPNLGLTQKQARDAAAYLYAPEKP
jgi:cytochrome c2